ncbi:MAG TPA: TRAP transporter substrate-binding protein [Stellaceae bacterium]|nr:TRAP transporter substrate-binding protein [Stellaceae bacterium]
MERRVPAAALAACVIVGWAAHAPADPVQLRFGYPSAPNNALFTEGAQGWVDDVNKEAAGAIEIKVYPGGVLGDNSNLYDRTLDGVTDIALGVLGPLSSQFPKTNVATLPFEAKNQAEAALALWRLYAKGVIADEFTKVHPLALLAFPPLVIHSRKPIHALADMKGLKVSVEGRVLGTAMPRLGAVPISLQPGELYPSLQHGLVQAVAQGWPSVPAFHLDEVTTYHLEVPLGVNIGYVFMNKDSYSRLPPKGKEAIDRLSGEAYVARLNHATDTMQKVGIEQTKAMAGQTIAQLAPDEEARWKALIAPVTDDWIMATPDGAKVLAAYRAELASIRAAK